MSAADYPAHQPDLPVYDHPVSFLDLCAFEGICPHCGDAYVDCRCAEDAELETERDVHPVGCLCCLHLDIDTESDLDAEVNAAPVRVVWPRPARPVPFLTATTLRLGSTPRFDERTSLISSGAL